jgi:hypothetical protein
VAQQPDDFDIAMRLGLEAAAGADAVELAVDVELEQVLEIIARPGSRLSPTTAQPAEPAVVGLDGGYVRSRHGGEGRHFEVM